MTSLALNLCKNTLINSNGPSNYSILSKAYDLNVASSLLRRFSKQNILSTKNIKVTSLIRCYTTKTLTNDQNASHTSDNSNKTDNGKRIENSIMARQFIQTLTPNERLVIKDELTKYEEEQKLLSQSLLSSYLNIFSSYFI
jgi:hypothetical protein